MTFDRVAATEAGQHRARPAREPRPRACSCCGWTADKSGYYLRPGDDRKMHQVGDELICSLCVTPADLGSRQWHDRPDSR